MAGLLLYGLDFRADEYSASDGSRHHEILPVDGDVFSISGSTWKQLTALCSDFGIPAENWPVYESSIDAPSLKYDRKTG